MGIPVTVHPPVPPALVAPAESYPADRAVSFGLPVGPDRLDGAHLRVRGAGGVADADTRVLARWPDGDPKWVLATFPALRGGAGRSGLRLEIVPGPAAPAPRVAAIGEDGAFAFAAAGTRFRVGGAPGRGLVESVVTEDGTPLSRAGGPALDLVLVDDAGVAHRAWRDSTWLAENGAHRAVLVATGPLRRADGGGGDPIAWFIAEMEFDRNRPGPVVRVTLRNDDGDVRKNVRFRSAVLAFRFDAGGGGFTVCVPRADGPGEWTATAGVTAIQGRTDLDVRGADNDKFRGPENLGRGYVIVPDSGSPVDFGADSAPVAHWIAAKSGAAQALGSVRRLESNWGSLGAAPSGDLVIGLFAPAQGPHTIRYGSWETREALVLAGAPGTIDAAAEAFEFEHPRRARLDDPSAWNRSGAFPSPLTSLAVRESVLERIEGAGRRDLRTCPDAPYRVRYYSAGTPGGSNQWDAAHDYWFAWASTGDPNAWLIAEAWADYRTDRAVPHGGASDPENEGDFPVTADLEVFDNGHRHSRFLPLFFFQTGQARFDLAAHDEFSNLYGSDRIAARYMESRITSRLIELGALFSAYEIDRGFAGGDLLYPRVRDYLGHMLSLRWDFDDPTGSEGWANEPNRRDRDPRTFWAASPGKGDPLVDVTFMVASLLPRALRTWLDHAPALDPHRAVVEKRLVDCADFNWEYLVSKSDLPTWRGTFFEFDTRRGAPPAPGYGDPDFDTGDPPDLYHPLYDAFTSAYFVTGESRYLGYAAYWAAGQSVHGGPWVTWHRPDFQRFAHAAARAAAKR